MTDYKSHSELNIKELAELLSVSNSTIRYWEDFFQIEIERTKKNSRLYRPDNIKQFQEIKDYITRGYALKDIKSLLNQSVVSSCNQVEVIQEKEPVNSHNDFIERLLNKVDKLQEDKARLIARTEFLELQNNDYQNKLTLLMDIQTKNWWHYLFNPLKFVNFSAK